MMKSNVSSKLEQIPGVCTQFLGEPVGRAGCLHLPGEKAIIGYSSKGVGSSTCCCFLAHRTHVKLS